MKPTKRQKKLKELIMIGFTTFSGVFISFILLILIVSIIDGESYLIESRISNNFFLIFKISGFATLITTFMYSVLKGFNQYIKDEIKKELKEK